MDERTNVEFMLMDLSRHTDGQYHRELEATLFLGVAIISITLPLHNYYK